MKRYQILSGGTLKHIAMASMLTDHVYKAVVLLHLPASVPVYVQWLCYAMEAFGRFAFPIFSFLLVEGFYHTKNRWRYLGNLLIFALISEIPFNLMISAYWRMEAAQNIYFTWAIALGTIWLVDTIRQKTKYWLLCMIPVVLAGCVLAMQLSTDYQAYGVLVVLALYLLRARPLVASLAGYGVMFQYFWTLPSCFLTNHYNGQRGKQRKWLNYWFYPVHLLVLGLVRVITGR